MASKIISTRNLVSIDESISMADEIELYEDGKVIARHIGTWDIEYPNILAYAIAYRLSGTDMLSLQSEAEAAAPAYWR